MSDLTIHVAMCADFSFVLPLAVSLASLDEVSDADEVTVHVLHPGYSQATRERVTAPLSALNVSWIEVDEQELGGAFYSPFLSVAANYRLLLDKLLPADLCRVLYLDCDTVIHDSLAGLFTTELRGQVIGAVRDSSVPWAASMMGSPWRELGVEPSSAYFNSGLMLIDLPQWREESVGGRSLDLLRTFKPHWGDQDALNAVLENRWLELPLRWNVQTPDFTGYCPGWALWREKVEDAIANPGVVHFTGHDKPWQFGTTHPRAVSWLSWLDRTSWSGWRPSLPKVGFFECCARQTAQWVRALWSRRKQNESMPTDLLGNDRR